ncbi:MAG: hypothetical protein HYX67_02490 [Candidatus Melainabacteria bacterium]|nr:hypothetical protein [Candidatus Melainabacteria bacterium]
MSTTVAMMKKLVDAFLENGTSMFELILSLLGKSIDGPEFRRLVQELGSPSSVYDVPIDEKNTLRMLEFYHFGFGASYSLQTDSFRMIGIEYRSPSKIRPMEPFPEAGPAGIDHQDSKRAVQKKMALLPIASRKLKSYMRVTYKTEPHLIECQFDGKGQELLGFTVALIETSKILSA